MSNFLTTVRDFFLYMLRGNADNYVIVFVCLFFLTENVITSSIARATLTQTFFEKIEIDD